MNVWVGFGACVPAARLAAGDSWCVEEREIERLRALGRGRVKWERRLIGRAIRKEQRRLRAGRRSISINNLAPIQLADFARPGADRTVIHLGDHTYITREAFEAAWRDFTAHGLVYNPRTREDGSTMHTFTPRRT